MPRTIIHAGLLAALCLPVAAAEAASVEKIERLEVRVESCAPRLATEVREKASLTTDRRDSRGRSGRTTPYANFRFLIGTDRAEARNVRLAVRGCEDGGLAQLDGGVATIRCRGESAATLTVARRGVRNCSLTGRIDDAVPDLLAGSGPGGGPHGPRPDPGGPDQGVYAARSLANLRIRAAEPVPGDPEKLTARVVNVGPGPSGTTRLKIFFHTAAGQVLTAHESVPALSAGQQTGVEIGVGQPLAAAETVTLRVDDPNVVPETSELDNGYTFKK